MQLTFLAAKVPLTKKFVRSDDGTLEKNAYPLVKKFTSVQKEAADIEEFHHLLTQHAKQGTCLLKGNVQRPLVAESRAGSTNRFEPTSWVVFDVDGVDGATDAEWFVKNVLPEAFHDTSYIEQHSASSGITGDGMRSHIFFMLQAEASPEAIKAWIQERNFTVDILEKNLSLASNAMTIRYPLDITVCQNDKLIFIAPPTCEGFEDPLTDQRIILHQKKHKLVDFTFYAKSPSELRGMAQKKVNELRKAAGLKIRHTNFKVTGGIEYLANPDTSQVTGEKEINGFIRINLAGQNDSWGHYYDPKRPLFLYNFKGEPVVLLRDFLPDYYQQVVKPRLTQSDDYIRPLVFRDLATDAYWNGLVDTNGNLLRLHAIGSKDKIEDSFAARGMAPPDPIPEWEYVFDPTTDTVVDWDKQICNRWQPTEVIQMATDHKEIPPVTQKLINHVLGNDEECIEHFMNWIAYVYQHRTKTGTAWVLHGTQGTGKGLLFNNVLAPIFGKSYCVTKLLHDLDDKFNAYLETALLFNVDEARINDQGVRSNKLVNQIKAMITEPSATIRGMRENPREVRNFTNFIFTSNEYDAIRISEEDRRFNVAPRQEAKIDISPEEVESLKVECYAFAGYLKAYSVDKQQAHTVIHNAAKAAMRKASQTTVEQFADSLDKGNLDYFVEGLDGFAGADVIAFGEYKQIVTGWIEDIRNGRASIVSKKDAHTAYLALMNPRDMPLLKFTRMMEHKNLTFDGRYMVDKVRKRGRKVEWMDDIETQESWNLAPSFKVIDGKKETNNETDIPQYQSRME